MDDNYQDLANAIVVQAAKDYKWALKKLLESPDDLKAKNRLLEIEVFFRSDYYRLLTDLDGEMLIAKLKQEDKLKQEV